MFLKACFLIAIDGRLASWPAFEDDFRVLVELILLGWVWDILWSGGDSRWLLEFLI